MASCWKGFEDGRYVFGMNWVVQKCVDWICLEKNCYWDSNVFRMFILGVLSIYWKKMLTFKLCNWINYVGVEIFVRILNPVLGLHLIWVRQYTRLLTNHLLIENLPNKQPISFVDFVLYYSIKSSFWNTTIIKKILVHNIHFTKIFNAIKSNPSTIIMYFKNWTFY